MAKRSRRMEYVVKQQGIPGDVLFEILSRLPAKSLIHCKCVCKSWRSLIRDPLFVRAHRTMYKSRLNQLLHTTSLLLTTYTLTPEKSADLFSIQVKKNESSGIVTSTHPPIHLRTASYAFCWSTVALTAGVVCYYSIPENGPVHIFNPSTREVLTFPIQIWECQVTIGFSCLTNEYKILQSRRIGGKRRSDACFHEFKILTLGGGNGTWRDLPGIDYENLGIDPYNLKFWMHSLCINGAIHWVQVQHGPNNEGHYRPILLVFDVGQEMFRVIPLPQDLVLTWVANVRLIELNGCLSLFNLEVIRNSRIMDFWILNKQDDQPVWVKDSIIFPQQWVRLGSPYPACSIHTGDLLLTPTQSHGARYRLVYLYDMKLKTYVKTDILLPERGTLNAAYDETIFPLK